MTEAVTVVVSVMGLLVSVWCLGFQIGFDKGSER